MQPLVSIVIPLYNREHFISDTLKSVRSQTFENWECIVVDDGSTDNGIKVVEQICKEDSRIKLIQQTNNGAQSARNNGIKAAKGKWINFLDSDDTFFSEKLESQLVKINQDDQVDVVTCYSEIVNKVKQQKSSFEWKTKGNILKGILDGTIYVDYNCAIIRKSKLVEMGFLDEACPSFQEWDTHIRLAEISKYDYVPKPLVSYYIHGNQISSNPARAVKGRLYLYKKHADKFKTHLSNESYLKKMVQLESKINVLNNSEEKTKLHKIFSELVNQNTAKYNLLRMKFKSAKAINGYKSFIYNKLKTPSSIK